MKSNKRTAKMTCEVKTDGRTIGIVVKHPGITRSLICYNLQELKKIQAAINAFLATQPKEN